MTEPSERANKLAKAVLDLVDARDALEETYDHVGNEEEERLRKQDFDNAIIAFEAQFDAAVEALQTNGVNMQDDYIIITQPDALKRASIVFHGGLAQAGNVFGPLYHRDPDVNPTEDELRAFVSQNPDWKLYKIA